MKTEEFKEKFEAAFPDGDVRFVGFRGENTTMRGIAEVSDDEESGTVLISLWYDEDYGTAFRVDPSTVTVLPDRWEVNSMGMRWAIRPGNPRRD